MNKLSSEILLSLPKQQLQLLSQVIAKCYELTKCAVDAVFGTFTHRDPLSTRIRTQLESTSPLTAPLWQTNGGMIRS